MNFNDFFTAHNIVAVVLLIIGIIWLIIALLRNYKINSIARWPRTNAVVLNSALATSGHGFLNFGSSNTLFGNVNKQIYYPKVLYQYNINGNNYQSTNVSYANTTQFNAVEINAIMLALAKGNTVSVAYNPNNYAESYIFNGTKSNSGIFWGIFLILVALALGYYHNMVQRKKEYKTEKAIDTLKRNYDLTSDADTNRVVILDGPTRVLRKNNRSFW